MIFDSGIAKWLCNGGIVNLAVPVSPIADQVHNHIAVKRVTIIDGKFRHAHNRIGILRIDMEDWNGQTLRNIGRKSRGIRLLGTGSKSDQIIYDDVDAASN